MNQSIRVAQTNERKSENIVYPKYKDREVALQRVCNLCKQTYIARTRFGRFCSDCKEHSELYHFYEWLPAA